MSSLLLIDLIDYLAGAGNEFCTGTKQPTIPFRVTHRFSLHLSPVSCTHFHIVSRSCRARDTELRISCQRSTRNKRRRTIGSLCIITHVHADRPYANYPHFQSGSGTRRTTVVLRNITRLRNQDTWSRVHFRVIEADHLQIILVLAKY